MSAAPTPTRRPPALRATLTAWLALVFVVVGLFASRPMQPLSFQAAATMEAASVLGSPLAPHRGVATRARPATRLGAQPSRLAARRGARYDEARHRAPTVAWPDLEAGAPSAPRFFFRKLPADDGSDADADLPAAPFEGRHSRAPPALASLRPIGRGGSSGTTAMERREV